MKARVLFVLVVVVVAGCAQAKPVHQLSTTCASTAPGASITPGASTVVEAAVRDGRAEPAPHRVAVAVGGAVQLRVGSDRQAEVHVHGYDFAWEVEPGAPSCVSFVADRAGLFDVEAHPDVLLFQLEVR